VTRFGFVVHPLHIGDVARKYALIGRLPERWTESLIRFIPPSQCGHMTNIVSLTGAATEGWLIGCPMTARQLLEGDPEQSLRKVVTSCEIAADLGAEIVGLGAFTSVFGDKGVSIADRVGIGVTTGNSYTTATAIEGALLAATQMGHDPAQSHAVILGATGSIGRICAHMLQPQVGTLELVGRRESALNALLSDVNAANVTVQTDIARALADADIVIAVTSAVETVVEPEHLKPGAVVIDVGINRLKDAEGKTQTVGDVLFEEAVEIASQITPVPGGVGTVTTAMLLKNVIDAANLAS